MAGYDLPTTAEIGGVEYDVRSDFRAVLDAVSVMGDPELTDTQRASLTLQVMFVDWEAIPRSDLREALEWTFWFVSGGTGPDKGGGKKPRLMDWEQDFPLIVGPVNRVLGYECRSCEYLHWWTFLSAYSEIGDCTFAQVVGIRKKRATGKKLDKADQQFYQEHRDMVDLKRQVTAQEAEVLEEWTQAR